MLEGSFTQRPERVLAVFAFVQVYLPNQANMLMPQAWTLDVEMAFYIVVPPLAFVLARVGARMGRRGRAALVLGSSACSPCSGCPCGTSSRRTE
jgi:peptidoglycan/LPS O-acetylase OafA/YrhL